MLRCPSCRSRKLAHSPEGFTCERCNFKIDRSISINPISLGGSIRGGENTPFVEKSSKLVEKQANRSLPVKGVSNTTTTECIEIDYHNTAYKFAILRNSERHLPIKVPMVNWTEERTETKRALIRRSPHYLSVYLKGRSIGSSENISDMGKHLRDVASAEASAVAKLLDMEIADPEPVRKEIKVCEPFVSGLQVQTDLFKIVYPTGEVEFIDKKEAEKHVINFVENMATVRQIPTLTEHLNQFGFQLDRHLNVLGEMSSSLKKMREYYERPTMWQKVKRWFYERTDKGKAKVL